MENSHARINAILFDIGNVLVTFDYQRAIQRLTAEPPESATHSSCDELKRSYETGEIDHVDFLIQIRELFAYAGTDDELTRSWADIFEPNLPVWSLVDHLAAQYPLYLCSNISDLHMEYLRRKYPIFQKFSGGVYSYLEKVMKPDPAIFHSAARKLGLIPLETVYIDDVQENVESAMSCGYQAFEYNHLQHGKLLEWLRGRGVGIG